MFADLVGTLSLLLYDAARLSGRVYESHSSPELRLTV